MGGVRGGGTKNLGTFMYQLMDDIKKCLVQETRLIISLSDEWSLLESGLDVSHTLLTTDIRHAQPTSLYVQSCHAIHCYHTLVIAAGAGRSQAEGAPAPGQQQPDPGALTDGAAVAAHQAADQRLGVAPQ